jgi:hypothetical protein
MKIKKAGLIVIVLVILTLAGCAGTASPGRSLSASELKLNLPAGRSIGQIELQMKGDFPRVPELVKIYQIVPPELTVESVTKLGNRLGMTGTANTTDQGLINMVDQPAETTLTVYPKSGAIFYGFTNDEKLYPGDTQWLPTAGEAKDIATRYLKRNGLFYSDVQFSEVGEGGSMNGQVGHWRVLFSRRINDLTVIGTGAKYAVRVGIKGEVVELLFLHPELEFYQNSAIKPPSQAFEDLKANGGAQLFKPEATKALIEQVSLGYWMNGINESQEYLLPVYQFKGQCYDGNDKALGDFSGWVEALKE